MTYIRETLKKPKSQAPNSQHFQDSELSCTGPPSQGKVCLLCFNSWTDATIPAGLPVRCTCASICNQWLTRIVGDLDEQVCETGWVKESWNCIQACEAGCYSATSSSSTMRCRCWIAAKVSLEKLLKEKKISDLQAFEFKKDCNTMLASTVAKIQERSPLKYSLARKLVCLDPQKMVATPEEAVKMFQAVLQRLIHSGWKTSCKVIPFCLSSGGLCLMQGSTTRSSSHCTSTTTQD